jgi:subtilisin family serine protease
MQKKTIIAFFVSLMILTAADTQALYRADATNSAGFEPTGLIVKLKPETATKIIVGKGGRAATGFQSLDALNQRFNMSRLAPLLPGKAAGTSSPCLSNIFILEFPEGTDVPALAGEYEGLPGVVYAEPDYIVRLHEVSDDSLYRFQWSLNNVGQEHYHVVRNWGSYNDELILTNGLDDADIDAHEVYLNPPDKTTAVVVAIIDTGVDLDHPDLAENIWINPGETADNGVDDDHNGYIDDVHGWDFAPSIDPLDEGDNDPTDEYGHGTHCAGIVAAVADNGIGIRGIAKDCRIMALKFDPLPLVSRIARAIVYATDNGADVINMSFGQSFRSDLIEEAINYAGDKGVILCASSGNDGAYAVNFPAGYDATIAIGASTDSDHVASFSTYGDHLSVCAPGLAILSLRADKTDMYATGYPYEPRVHVVDSIYFLASGTSMSCPHVVGVAAWLRAVSPGLTHDRAREILELSADDITDPYGVGWELPGRDQYSGFGRVNLQKALAIAPKMRAEIISPIPNEIVGGAVQIAGIADGDDFTGYILDYGEGDNPSSWTQMVNSHIPVTDGTLGAWNTDGLAGRYTLRLRVGENNISIVSVFIANETVAEIISPSDEEVLANFASIIGSAYAPEFDYILLEYLPDTDLVLEWTEIAKVTTPIYQNAIDGWFLEDIVFPDNFLRLSLHLGDSVIAEDSIRVHVRSIFATEHAWKTNLHGYPTIIPNYGDIDGDGINEIIVGTSSGIEVFTPDGTIKISGVPDFPKNNFMIPIAVGNLDGDGIDDIVAMGYDPPIVYGFPSGAEAFENYLGIFPPVGNYYRTEHDFPKVFLKDIDGDGLDEIHVFVYDGSLSKTFLIRPDGAIMHAFDYYSEYLPADLNGDGIDEIYACNRGFCLLRQIDFSDGSTTDSLLIQMNGSSFNCMGISAYDINNDDTHELILFGYYLDFGYWIYALDYGLSLMPGWPHEMGIDDFVVPTVPIFGDVDDDNQAEYFTGFFDVSESYVLAWNLDGTSYIPSSPSGLFVTVPEPSVLNMLLLADVNGDASVDVVACADNDMFNTYQAQRIYAWGNEGQPIPGFPLITDPNGFTSDRFTPSVGDIDGDGNVDLIMTTPHSSIIFVNYPSYAYDECSSPAPFWRYNRRMNNIAALPSDCDQTDVASDSAEPIPASFDLAQNYPNPFNPTTTIRYSLPARSHITISVYNILGRKVQTLIDEVKSAGTHTAVWNGTDETGQAVSSGIYFYRVKTADRAESRKMLLLR